MNTTKWLKRKYPKSHKKILREFEMPGVETLKRENYKVGILEKDISGSPSYKKGTLFVWKRQKVYYDGVWDSTYDIYALFKCGTGITTSGYHRFLFCGEEFKILES